MKKKIPIVFCTIILLSSFLSFLPMEKVAGSNPAPKGNISFEPNVIPELEIHFVEEFFRFQWRQNRFDLKLLIHCEGKNLSLSDFWKREKEVNKDAPKWKQLKNNVTESMYEFGYTISDIPQEIAEDVEFLVWKIEDPSFDVDEIELREIETFEGYNITQIYLPDNLVLSYEDLWLYDFSVSHPNKLETVVKGVKGKTEWNLDPITYSAPTMTVIGGTEGSELDSMDIWNEDQTQGWNVFLNHNNTNTQFELNCLILFGNGTTDGTTWFADTEVQWVFNDGIMTAHYQKWMELTRYSHVRFGVLEDATEKTTSRGCSFISLENTYLSYLAYPYVYDTTTYFYSCHISAKASLGCQIYALNLRLYNSLLSHYVLITDSTSSEVFNSQITKVTSGIVYPRGTWDKCELTEMTNALYIRYGGTINNLYVRKCTNLWYDSSFNDADLYLVNCDSDTWTGTWTGGNGEVWRQYSFDLTVTYPNGTGIENANVTVKHYGQGETEDFTELTDSNGQITTKTLSKCFYNQSGGDTPYSFEPFNIDISNITDYQDYNANFTLPEKKGQIIALTPTVEDETYIWWTLSLCWIPVAIALLIVAQKRRLRADRTRNYS